MAHVPGMVATLGTDMGKVAGRRDRQMIHGAEKAESPFVVYIELNRFYERRNIVTTIRERTKVSPLHYGSLSSRKQLPRGRLCSLIADALAAASSGCLGTVPACTSSQGQAHGHRPVDVT